MDIHCALIGKTWVYVNTDAEEYPEVLIEAVVFVDGKKQLVGSIDGGSPFNMGVHDIIAW